MNISLFHKCFYLWLEDNTSCQAKVLLISDKQNNDQITSDTFEDNSEWRDANGEPIDKPSECVWDSITAYESAANEVADFNN